MSTGSGDPPTPDDAPDPPSPSNAEGEGSVRVVGTAHVSEESVREVEETIDEERPDIVAVELDEGRYRQMKGGTPDDLDPSDLLGGNTVFQFLAYWMLSYVQTRMGEKFDIEPGAELLAAVEAAEERGIGVALVDREINTTIQRFWARLTIIEKFRMLGGLAFGVTDPRIAGVTFGIAIGVILGPLIGLFGGSVGLTTGLLTQIGTGGIVALLVGYAGFELGSATVGGDRGLLGGVGAGIAAGSVVAVSGLGVGLATSILSPFVVSMVGS
ncbi:MAG: TraB/GumN family protein, partial [Halobaculum sp.]